jgi:prepilin-type N-terminal cleavage/methylation domain-containing protein
MKATVGRSGGKGFTLIELLAVIGIIGVLAALIFPAVKGMILRGQAVAAGNDARQIWLGLYTENSDRELRGEAPVWPKSGQFATSTDFFKTCIASNWLGKEFSFKLMGATGVPKLVSKDPSRFTALNNAWCVVLDLEEDAMDETPFLFTRNLVSDGGTTLKDINALRGGMAPFGDAMGVIITRGGAVVRVRGADATKGLQPILNPFAATNAFLRP